MVLTPFKGNKYCCEYVAVCKITKLLKTISWNINKSCVCCIGPRYHQSVIQTYTGFKIGWQNFPSAPILVRYSFSAGFPSFILSWLLVRKVSACLLSFWMTRGHSTTCSHCFWYWPYSFICGRGIILFIGPWNWSALPDQRFDPLFLKCAGKGQQILSPIWRHLLWG